MKKKGVKTLSRTFRVLYYWGKFLGINPLIVSKKNQLEYSYSSRVYAYFLVVMYFYTYFCAMVKRLRVTIPGETPVAIMVDFLGISCQFLEASSTWFVFAIHQSRIKNIVKRFVTAGKTSQKLGISDDYDEEIKELGVHLLIHNIIFVVSIIMSNIMWEFFNNFDLFIWARCNIPAIASFNAAIIFMWCMILVRRKFRRLNETVLFLMQNGHAIKEDLGCSGLISERRCDIDLLLDRVDMVSQLHRELRDLIYCIEGHFASFILFSVGNIFTFITLNTYGIYNYMQDHPRELMDLLYLGAICHWVLYPVALLVAMSSVCGSTSNEANNTGNMLHKLLNSCKPFGGNRETLKFNSLSLDLLQNQVSMTVYGLFELDHYLVSRTVVAATSYLMVMLQLY